MQEKQNIIENTSMELAEDDLVNVTGGIRSGQIQECNLIFTCPVCQAERKVDFRTYMSEKRIICSTCWRSTSIEWVSMDKDKMMKIMEQINT